MKMKTPPVKSIVGDLERDAPPLILACSPRKGGNTDHAADLVAGGLEGAGAGFRLVHTRDMDLLPCRGCQACEKAPGNRCVLMERDQSEELFRLILAAPAIFIVSPIYFYHLPGAFKGFVDRAQRYYAARMAGDEGLAALPARRAHAVLVAGRPKGERLFEGSLLTLKYFLWPFNVVLGEALTLPGYDAAGDLRGDEAARGRVSDFAAKAWKDAGP